MYYYYGPLGYYTGSLELLNTLQLQTVVCVLLWSWSPLQYSHTNIQALQAITPVR